jgi:hypothetical protein
MWRRTAFVLAVPAAFVAGFQLAWSNRSDYDRLEKAVPYYEPLKNALYRGLARNDFARTFASDEDKKELRHELAFLDEEKSPRGKVLRLIAWIDRETKADEVMSVRAIDLYRARSGACEIHAFAVGALSAFDIKARWIGGVKSSIGFGYLEAFVDGKWELFRLRSKREDPSLHKSAWELWKESEPSLSIRDFWFKPSQTWTSWKGTVAPVLLPFGNVEDHPELETIFRTDQGLDLGYRTLNPFEYIYGYFGEADKEWIENESLVEMFDWHLQTEGMRNQRRDADRINWLGLTTHGD